MQVGSPLGSHQVVTRPSAPRRAAHWAVSLLVAGGRVLPQGQLPEAEWSGHYLHGCWAKM